MKFLSDYTSESEGKLFEDLGVFFASSAEQYEAAAIAGVDYCNLGGGMISPKSNAEAVAKGLSEIHAKGIAQDLKENGREAIIGRALLVHKSFHIDYIEDCAASVQAYGITRDEVLAAFNLIRSTEGVG